MFMDGKPREASPNRLWDAYAKVQTSDWLRLNGVTRGRR